MEDLLKRHNIGAYISKTGDEHLNEYIGDSDQRVQFLTGFTGSNGLAVTCEKSVLYTDSRYYLQAEKELIDYKLMKTSDTPIEEYLSSVLTIKRVGLCSRLFSKKYYDSLECKLNSKGIELVPFEDDLVDEIWEAKPRRVFNEVYSTQNEPLHKYYKKNIGDYEDFLLSNCLIENSRIVSSTFEEKLKKVREFIEKKEVLLITELDTICWLFNLRGSDIEYNPVFYSYAAVTKTDVKLFTNGKIHLEGVDVLKYEEFDSYLNQIDLRVVFSGSCNATISSKFPNGKSTEEIRRLQSVKGSEEIEGFNLAYILDGIALTQLFEHIEKNFASMKEKDIANKLHELKSAFYGYKGPSFPTIAGVGPNSAIVHYEAGDQCLEDNMPLLIDSGSHYVFGTTDTTRTLFIGEPSAEFKRNFTRVLKGQLRAMAGTYPCGVSGNVIDALTRLDLWRAKLDYGHASGHGVGHFLCVHEAPPTLSPNHVIQMNPSQIFSVEPGYYKDGEYGIRIENLVLSEDVGDGFMRLRNITYVPYQLNLIDVDLLTPEEVKQVNEISREIRRVLQRFLEGKDGYDYLMKNTKDLVK